MRAIGFDFPCREASIGCVKGVQSDEQFVDIAWLPGMDHIEVESGDGRSMQGCSNPTHHDEIDFVLREKLKDCQEIRFGSFHAILL